MGRVSMSADGTDEVVVVVTEVRRKVHVLGLAGGTDVGMAEKVVLVLAEFDVHDDGGGAC